MLESSVTLSLLPFIICTVLSLVLGAYLINNMNKEIQNLQNDIIRLDEELQVFKLEQVEKA